MIHLLYGQDTFRARRAVDAIRDELSTPDGMLASNTTLLDGAAISPQELLEHAMAVPFLTSHRLVILEGLLAHLGGERRGRRKKDRDEDPLTPWRATASRLADLPPTTTLIFLEAELSKSNPAFAIFAPLARTREFAPLDRGDAPPWIQERSAEKGLRLSPGAVGVLAQLLAPDLWAIDNALDKLAAYAGDAAVDETMVRELVSTNRDEKFWTLTDAVLAGEEPVALASLQRLLSEGESPPPLLAFMLAQQYRRLVNVKDLRDRRAPQADVARASGVPGWKLSSMTALAARYSWPQLRRAYGLLLAADLNVKRGLQDDVSSLQLLVHELCALAPKARGRPVHSR